MATNNIRDWKKIDLPVAKDGALTWRHFEKPSTAERVVAQEREHESRKRVAYDEYVKLVENDQLRVPQKYRIAPLSYEEWSQHLPADVTDLALAAQMATNVALLSKVRRDEAAEAEAERIAAREAVLAGKPDKSWQIPADADGLNMPADQVSQFTKEQAAQFVRENPGYHKSAANVAAIQNYLVAQGLNIPTVECIKQAWLRLKELGLIEEAAPVVPEPESPVQEPSVEAPDSGLVSGFDLETGAQRQYTQAEIWRMSSSDVKKAFKMWTQPDGTDNRARFNRGAYL
jgi:hypothetical protein